MDLLQMSVSGALMAAVILLVRAVALNRLPKQVFVVLWALVAVRLLVPISVPTPFSAFNLVDRAVGAVQTLTGTGGGAPRTDGAAAAPDTGSTGTGDAAGAPASGDVSPSSGAAAGLAPSASATAATSPDGAGAGSPSPSAQAAASTQGTEPDGPPVLRTAALVVWLVGAAGCGTFFAASYLRCRHNFRMSLPVRDPRVAAWLDRHGAGPASRRPVEVRQTDLVASPLSYGVAHPVILMPKAVAWDDARIPFILAHELAHVRRWDQLLKPVLVTAACVHWFNPFAWAMFVLANRDIELACDERAVRTLGTELRADYARTLLSMAQRRDLPALLYTAFGKNAIEERIGAIMKLRTRRITAASLVASAALVVGIPAALATSAVDPTAAGQVPAAQEDADGAAAPDPSATMPDGWSAGSEEPDGYTDAEWASVLDFLDEQFELVGGLVNETTVADFQDAAREAFGDSAGQDLLARLSADDALYRRALDESFAVEDGVDTYTFDRLAAVCFALVPLATGDGQAAVFSGTAAADDGSGDAFSYELTLALEDPGAVNVYAYLTTALYSVVNLDRVFDLAETGLRAPGLDAADRAELLDGFLTDLLGRGAPGLPLYGLPATLAYTYTPGDGGEVVTGTVGLSTTEEEAGAAAFRVQQSIWQAVVHEYLRYGLAQTDVPGESADGTAGYAFMFDGQSVRRIYDVSFGEVVTDWLDAPVVSDDDAVDLIADYDADGLAGLRVAADGEIEAYQDAYPLMPGDPGTLANGVPVGGTGEETVEGTGDTAGLETILADYTDAEWGVLTRFVLEQFDSGSAEYSGSSINDFRTAALETFGTPEGQNLLARLAADADLQTWAACYCSSSPYTPDNMLAYVCYALVPLTADDCADHTFTGRLEGPHSNTVLDYAVHVSFDDGTVLDVANYCLQAIQAVENIRTAYRDADLAAASSPDSHPESILNSVATRLGQGTGGAVISLGGLTVEVSYTCTATDGQTASGTFAPERTDLETQVPDGALLVTSPL